MFESIHEQVPELARLQATVTKLEQEASEAASRVDQLLSEEQSAHEDDLLREAKALNEGRRVPSPKEPEIKAKREGAERRLEVLQRRLQLAQSDLSRYISENAEDLAQLVSQAKALKAREVSELAAPLAKALHEYQLPDADIRALRPYLEGPQEENRGEPQDSVIFLGPLRRDNVADNLIGGQPIGRVQAIVAELSTLAARYEQGNPRDVTIVGPTPEESGEGAA